MRDVRPGFGRRHGVALRGSVAKQDDGEAVSAAEVLARMAALEKLVRKDVTELVRTIDARLNDLRVEQADGGTRLKDLETELGDVNTTRVRKSAKSYDEVTKKIAVVESAIPKAEKKIHDQEAAIQNLMRDLEGSGTQDLKLSQARLDVLNKAKEVFSRAVERYKARLREEVESTATDLFLRMTTESEYGGLEINSNYGLNIVHRDGTIEDGRSAGAEHVVALSLMGALQRNAPMRGPAVMDSPLFRLDPDHTRNVIDTLASMARQVVLLVHEAELRKEEVREVLGTKLLAEYRIERVSARQSRIRPVR